MAESIEKKVYCKDCNAYEIGGKCVIDGRRDHNALDEACADAILEPLKEPLKEPVKKTDVTPKKKCKKCGKVKPLTEFVKRTRAKDGTMDTCKECYHDGYGKRSGNGKRKSAARKAEPVTAPVTRSVEDLEPIAPPVIPPIPQKEVTAEHVAAFDLKGMSDEELCEELQRRGYHGTLSKCIILELNVTHND